MRTATLHNLPTTQATDDRRSGVTQACSAGQYPVEGLGSMRPWSLNHEILVEGAAFARGSKDPIQEALL